MTDAEQDIKRVEQAAIALSEHFDTVQIFATRHEEAKLNGTVRATFGVGNWYARYGQVREWLVRTEEASRVEERKDDK